MEASPPASNSERIDAYVWRVSGVVLIGSMMSILDTTIVNVALHTLSRELHSGISSIQWVVTGYLLALAAVIPITGWAGRRFGTKQVYLASLVLFTAGSALCGLASSTTELIVFRVLQGAGGGMIMPLGQQMMAEAAGPKRMGRVMGLLGVPTMLAPILGPTIGGLIVQNASWRWIFFVNVPIGVIAVIAALRVLPRPEPQRTDRLDVRGLALMATGLPLMTYGLAEVGSTGGFGLTRVILPFVLGLGLTAAFVVHSLHAPRPLLDLRLMRRPAFSSAAVAMFSLGAALFGAMVLLPLYWQGVRHQSAVHAGLLMAPQGIGAAAVMPFAGKLADRIGGGPPALFGSIVTVLASIPFALIGAHTSIVWLSAVMVVRGIGIGFAFMPVFSAAFATLERRELSDATPQLNVFMRLGGSFGTAILAVVLQRALVGTHTLAGAASAYGTAFWASVIIAAMAVVPCLVLLRAERAAKRARSAPPQEALVEVLA